MAKWLKRIGYPVIALIFATVSIYIIRYFIGRNEVSNIYSSLLGLCLDGLLFVCLASWIQKSFEVRNQRRLNAILTITLQNFVQDYVFWIAAGTIPDLDDLTTPRGSGNQLKPLGELADMGLSALRDGVEIAPGLLAPIQRYGRQESPLLRSLLPVSAQISHEHLKHWFVIVRELDLICESEPSAVQHSIRTFLEHVKSFSSL